MPELQLTNEEAAEQRDFDPLYTVAGTAERLRVSKFTVYKLFKTGQLSWVQIGAHRRVTAAEIDRFIEAHTQQAADQAEAS